MLSTFTSTNFIFAAIHHTSYQPCNVGTSAVDPWALQPRKAPWCFDTCMKIVLRDVQEKNRANPLAGNFNMPNINAIVSAQVPEEEIVHRVLLDNHAMGETDTIKDAIDAHRDAFLRYATNFFDYYLGNRTVHGKVGNIDNTRKVGLLNGLLGVALEDELNDLWNSLDSDIKKMIVQDSAQAVLDSIKKDTGIEGTIHYMTDPKNNLSEYNTALHTIANEIETNKRMVILGFQNTDGSQESHVCAAYATQRDDTPQSNLLEIKAFNPWGNPIEINANTNPGPYFNITTEPGAPKNWLLNTYVTFNY